VEIVRSVYTDLIFHIFAHMKIDNAYLMIADVISRQWEKK
jgi:hypothetical protein